MRKVFQRMLLAASMVVATFTSVHAVDIPRPEYPRPQFERADWVNLNGQWTCELDFSVTGEQRGWINSKGLSKKITVPFCPESELSGIGYTDFIPCVWYQRSINIPAEWNGKRILLQFGAVDYQTQVYVDGKLAGEHYGTGSSFAIDLTNFVKAGQQANLVIQVKDDLRSGMQPGGKQSTALFSAGCSYTRVTGIWQTVWMEAVNEQALKNVFAIPDIDQQQLVVRPEFYDEGCNNTLTVEVIDGKKTISKRTAKACNQSSIVLPIKNARLWSPEDPYLYDVKYTVRNAQGEVIDQVSSYVGMRKVHISGGYFYLNNKPYYQRLVLDQGYYPDGIWTAPSDEALRQDIAMSKAVGFNGARLHQKVFEERYYYWADKLGYLTWGEEASWGLDINNDRAVRNFLSEWADIVVRDRNHPSLVTWTPLNETWNATKGVYVRFVNDLYNLTKAIDPTRPVNDASGDSHVKTDIWSVHDYTREPEKLIANHTIKAGVEPYRNMRGKDYLANYAGQPYMVDEFGGLPRIPKEERANSWGYGQNIDTLEEFYSILEKEI
ncbi:MAG: glycoside hydrolase family 2 protein, partial [Bacteroidaceae bacterium]